MNAREKIKKSFIELVVERQSIKISVRDIVEKADVSRRSFYNHYVDRQSITEEIYIDTIENTLKNCFNEKMTTRMFIIEVYKTFLINKDFFLIAIKDNQQNSLFDTIIERSQVVFIHLFKDVIQDKTKLEYLSYKYASTQVMLIKKWINNGMKESPEFMTEIYLDYHENYENLHEIMINKNTNW